jgi:hypothetical protein
MSQIEVERFLGRMVTDEHFRARAEGSLVATCFCEGVGISTREMALLGHLDYSLFGALSQNIDGSITRK